MRTRVIVLGAGFGGLELTTMLSEALGEDVDLTLIDKAGAFTFGYSKLDVMLGRATPDSVRNPYSAIVKPGVRFIQQEVVGIDPKARRVTTRDGALEADFLVVALGADYDLDATPGLVEAGNEFYSNAGARRLAELIPQFSTGRAVVGVCATPFKCPPAPSEAALLLHDYLTTKGVRGDCEIAFAIPFQVPVPPSPETSTALVEAFAQREIVFMPGRRVVSLDAQRKVVIFDDESELEFDLFLGVPKHCVPNVVATSDLVEDGWIPVDSRTLQTSFSGVYAIGDVANVGVPKAGVFAEGAARVVAEQIISTVRNGDRPDGYSGQGSCYIEFGAGRVGRVDVDFLSGPSPTGTFNAPSDVLVAEKLEFGASRRARWFDR